jgi:hypothetical protein
MGQRHALVGLVALVIGSIALRIFLARKIAAPQLLCDEFIYAGVAKSLALHGHFMLRHEPNGASFVYPALIAPAWWANSMETAYGLAKSINAVVMTLTAIPFFLWARRLSNPGYALGATALLLVLPAFDYTGLLLTENAFLPAFVAATFAIARMLERPTVLWQSLAVAAIVFAVGVRAQGVALVAVLPGAMLLEELLERRRPRVARLLRTYWISLGALGILGVLYVAARLLRSSPSGILNAYGDVLGADYSLLAGLRSAAYHLAELTLVAGVFPMAAFLLLAAIVAVRPTEATAAERSFVAVAIGSVVALLLEIGLFTSRFAGPVEERYSFYLGTLLLLGLVAWLHKGLPRPPGLTACSAIVTGTLVVWMPLADWLKQTSPLGSFGLYPLHRLLEDLDVGRARLEFLVTIGALLALAAFAAARRKALLLGIPLTLAVLFVSTTWLVFGALRDYGRIARYATGLGRDSSWIEHDLGRDRPVTFLYSEAGIPKVTATRILVQTEFWNRNVRWVTNMGPSELCPLPEKDARVDLGTGSIRPATVEGRLSEPTVVTIPIVRLAGKELAYHPPLVAYRIEPPLRLSGNFEGVYPDGWTGAHAAYSGYEAAKAGQTLLVHVSRATWGGPDAPGHVTVRVGTLVDRDGRPQLGRVLARRRWVIHSGATRIFRFPAPRRPFRVELNVEPTFVPADFGYGDTRPLGAAFTVRLVAKGGS